MDGGRGTKGPRCDEGPLGSAQALGRLPWLAFFFLRARFLLPRLAILDISLHLGIFLASSV